MNPHEHDPEEPTAPARLVHALKALSAERVFVPRSVDESILRRARQQLEPARAPSPGGWWRGWLFRVAAAASIVLVAALAWLSLSRSSRSGELAEDLNGDGRVDILDAFQLARTIESGEARTKAPDLNGDGVVDRADAELVARRAVRLGGPS